MIIKNLSLKILIKNKMVLIHKSLLLVYKEIYCKIVINVEVYRYLEKIIGTY